MNRPEPNEYHPSLAAYIDLVPEDDIVSAMASQAGLITDLAAGNEGKGGHRYAPGKWSIREVIGHIGDAERVFGYRMFAIARGDQQPLPGFEENEYMAASHYDDWTMSELIETFSALRTANLNVLRPLDDETLLRRGTANGRAISVRALAYAIAGHARHHLNVLRERYL